MRVRYQMVGASFYQAECDLTEKKARKLFNELKTNAFCEWVELVGEEDYNYMDVLEVHDKTRLARALYEITKGF